MNLDTITGLDEPPGYGGHPDLDAHFGDADSTAEEISHSSPGSASFPAWVKPLSDSDSVDSLFLTQCEALPVRTVRRQRPAGGAVGPPGPAAGDWEPRWENEESSGPLGPRAAPAKPSNGNKGSRKRRSTQRYKLLTRRKTLTYELAALGGFFKRVMEMKESKRRKKRCYDGTKRCLSPLSDSDAGEDNEGVKIVDLQNFIPKYKTPRRAFIPWLDGNDPVDTVTRAAEDASAARKISDPRGGRLESDGEADVGESERTERGAERRPVRDTRSGRVSGRVAETVDSRFGQEERQPMARRAWHPDSEMAAGAEDLRTMMKDAVRQRGAAAGRPPATLSTTLSTTLSRAGDSEEEAGTERPPARDYPAKRLLTPGDLGNSQGGETREEAERGPRTGEETSVDLQGSVRDERLTVPDLILVETEDIVTVKGIIPSITESPPAERLKGDKRSNSKRMDDEESRDPPPDSVSEEGGTAGGSAEPVPCTPPPGDRPHQIQQDEKHGSRVGEGEHSVLNFGVSEPLCDSASSDAICEEGIRKKNKKKMQKGNRGDVEESMTEPPCETLSDGLHLAPPVENSCGAAAGECSHLIFSVPDPVGDTRDVVREEGIRKRKKKKREKDNEGDVGKRGTEPPCDSIRLPDDKQKNSAAGVGEHSLCVSRVPEPEGDSASRDVICEEGITRRKKKRKKDNCGIVEQDRSEPSCDSLCLTNHKHKNSEAGVDEHSLCVSRDSEPVIDSASGNVICEEGMRKEKKRKRKEDGSGNVEEYVNEPPRETFSDSLHLTSEKESSGAGAGACEPSLCISSVPEPVSGSACGDVICEEGMRKRKKKKREKDNEGDVGEHGSEPPCDSLCLPDDKQEGSGDGVGEQFSSIPNVPEAVSSSTSGDVICEEGIRKKKKKKRKEGKEGDAEERGREPPSQTVKGQAKTLDEDRSSTAGEMEHSLSYTRHPESVDDFAFSRVICDGGKRKKKKKKERDYCETMEELVAKPLPHTPNDN